jgi:endonuclease/exonuclease/phosphatase family metal-dependent hydrolase
MRVLTWNVKGAFPHQAEDEIEAQIEYLAGLAHPPDLLLLNEVNQYRREFVRELIRDELGYGGIVDTLSWAHELRESDVQPHHDIGHTNGNLTAVRDPDDIEHAPLELFDEAYDDADRKHLSTHYPEKILVTTCTFDGREIEVWNVRAVPGGMKGEEKIKIFETVFDRIMNGPERLRILAGDFNAPDEELADGQAIVHIDDKDPQIQDRWRTAALQILKGLGHAGMVDVFRYQWGYGDIDTLDESFGNSRFDHIIASEDLNPVHCEYDAESLNYSDHAALIADFEI